MCKSNEMYYPKVLIISNNPFSLVSSNGRTLSNLFSCWDKKKIAQFYISNENSDHSLCENYYQLTDRDMLKAFLTSKKPGRVVSKEQGINISISDRKQKSSRLKKILKNTSIGYFSRSLIWRGGKLNNHKLEAWINDFSPEVVLLQVGDYGFMIKIAMDIAQKRRIPLIIYNSEDYYFKKRKKCSILYNLYQRYFRETFERMVSMSAHIIYSNEYLEKTYVDLFEHRSTTLYTPSFIQRRSDLVKNNPPIISYIGNLGVGRHESLISLANALETIDDKIKLDIYGKVPDASIRAEFEKHKAIRYKGFINYETVIETINKSDILVHTENFSEFYTQDLKHAFSTKVSDSLASGVPFFVYAPPSLAITRYLSSSDAACVVCDKSELIPKLRAFINNDDLKLQYVEKALKVSSRDFNPTVICRSFYKIIMDAFRGESCE